MCRNRERETHVLTLLIYLGNSGGQIHLDFVVLLFARFDCHKSEFVGAMVFYREHAFAYP